MSRDGLPVRPSPEDRVASHQGAQTRPGHCFKALEEEDPGPERSCKNATPKPRKTVLWNEGNPSLSDPTTIHLNGDHNICPEHPLKDKCLLPLRRPLLRRICRPRAVGKYLYWLNPKSVDETRLLEVEPVEKYIAELISSGMGPSGVLSRILAHKAALNFLRPPISYLHTTDFIMCTIVILLKIIDDTEIRRADRVSRHLSTLYKSYNKDKTKQGRDLLLAKSLEGGTSSCLDAMKRFRDDSRVGETFRRHAAVLLQGHLSRSTYNTCVGLLAAPPYVPVSLSVSKFIGPYPFAHPQEWSTTRSNNWNEN